MQKRTTWFLPALTGVFVLLLGVLLVRWLGLSTGRDYLDSLSFPVTEKGIELVIHDKYPGWNIKLNRDDTLALFEETEFLREGRYVLDDNTLQEYQPRQIVLIFEQMPAERPKLMQLFMGKGRDIYGYNRQMRTEEYEINFYLEDTYFDGLDKEKAGSELKSLVTKAALYLGQLHQKKRRLSAEEKQVVFQRLPSLLQKYDFIDVEAP
jgi:hypothetical protein